MITQPFHPITLKFKDIGVEDSYNKHGYRRLVHQCRVAILVVSFAYLFFRVFSSTIFPVEVEKEVWKAHPSGLVVMFLVYISTFTSLFQRFHAAINSTMCLFGGGSILFLSLSFPKEGLHYYYPFIIFVIFFTFSMVGLRFIYSMSIGLILVLVSIMVLLIRGDLSFSEMFIYNCLLFFANVYGGSAAYMDESQRRRLFISQLSLNEEMKKAQTAKMEANNANTAKSRLLAAVSHDLRQPIHAQGLFLSMLERMQLNNEQQALLSRAIATSDTTNKMLHTLMNFYRIESGALKPEFTEVSLQVVFNKIEREFLALADDKGLDYRCRETDVVIYTDPELLEIILRNLVSNAIRYTNKGGTLLACRRANEGVSIEVWDTGIGIEPSLQQEVFNEFNQVAKQENDMIQGLGLGLAIVYGLCQTLAYPLSVQSTLGRGSVFRVTVPVVKQKRSNIETQVENLDNSSTTQLKPLTDIHILFIDDNETIRIATQQLFMEWQASCDAVKSMEAAAASARKKEPNLIISDYQLRNGITGIDVISALRLQLNKPTLPALLITGDNTPRVDQAAHQHHIPLLHKPISANHLFQHVVKLTHL